MGGGGACGQGGRQHSLALLLRVHGAVVAVEELPLEELHGDDGEDEHEELVHDEDVEDVLQRRDHAVEHRLEGLCVCVCVCVWGGA